MRVQVVRQRHDLRLRAGRHPRRADLRAGLAEFARLHAYRATADEKALLEQFIFGVQADGTACGGAKLNADVVGQSPAWIAAQAGFSVPEDTSIILVEVAVRRPGTSR